MLLSGWWSIVCGYTVVILVSFYVGVLFLDEQQLNIVTVCSFHNHSHRIKLQHSQKVHFVGFAVLMLLSHIFVHTIQDLYKHHIYPVKEIPLLLIDITDYTDIISSGLPVQLYWNLFCINWYPQGQFQWWYLGHKVTNEPTIYNSLNNLLRGDSGVLLTKAVKLKVIYAELYLEETIK